MKHFKLFLFLTILLFLSLQNNANAQTLPYDSIPGIQNLNALIVQSAIRSELSQLDVDSNPISTFISQWYETHNYQPMWIKSTGNNLKIDTLLRFISHVDIHGLKSSQFDFNNISNLSNQFKNNKLSYRQMAQLDTKVSTVFIQYCAGLTYGFINPGIFEAYHKSIQKADTIFISKCLNAGNTHLLSFLSRIQPRSKAYLSLQAERDNYKNFVDSFFTSIPMLAEKQTIKLNSYHPFIPLIARRLMISGELKYDPNFRQSYQTFNPKLLKALNKFRIKTGLLIDQEIGNSTIGALNMTFVEYIDKINVNLERLRWIPLTSLGKKYIRVNVADMTLNAFKNDTVALNMKVCVGRQKNMTPLLQSKIFELVINPTWTVPNSIIVKEIARIALHDISYFERNHIRVYLQGVEIDPSKVDWTKINTNYQPYKMVQDSGNENSLGRIKFNFKNEFSVYLHDTNAKGAFKHHNRAISHGCVRVEKPVELVNFCFPDLPMNYKTQNQKNQLLIDKIRHSIDLGVISKSGKDALKKFPNSMKIKRVVLNPSIPIVMDYQTCFINSKGNIQFRDDIYKLDSLLNRQLSAIHQN